MTEPSSSPIRMGIIGAGLVSDFHHVPGIKLDPRVVLAAVCDTDAALAEQRRSDWGVEHITTNSDELLADPEVDAVIIATPNFTHCPLTLTAAREGKHVLCEKPLGLNAGEVAEMLRAVSDAGVVHMTDFAYRFSPAMRYLKHIVDRGDLGVPRHFRSQRFLDWPETSWGWRQYKKTAGAGNLYDMTIHRIDFAMDLLGPLTRVSGAVAQFVPRDRRLDGSPCPPSDVDDWSCLMGEFASGAVGVWEGTTLAKGNHYGGFGHEHAEINGSAASAIYKLATPHTLLIGREGGDMEPVDVPAEFLKPAGSPRDPAEGDPAAVFRYDAVWEFVSAIIEQRAAVPSFHEGLNAQIVADAVLESHEKRQWVDINLVLK